MDARHAGLISALPLAVFLLAGCSAKSPTAIAPEQAAGAPTTGHSGVVLLEDFTGRQIFPASDGWNLDVSEAPVDPNSQAYIDRLSGRTAQDSTAVCKMQPYFGPPPWGIPYAGVSGAQALVPVRFVYGVGVYDVGAPGRPAGYPIPALAKITPGFIEGNVAGGGTYGDRHMILVDRDNGLLFETWATRWNADSTRWEAGGGVTFDLSVGGARAEGQASADASGMAIFPGLVRYDEATGPGEIAHAFRFTAMVTNGHVWPASNGAGSTPGTLPMGARLRLKASVDLSGYPPMMQKIFRAMQVHGLILADQGGCDLGVTGTMDARWNTRIVNPAFAAITADDFEVVQLGWGGPAAATR